MLTVSSRLARLEQANEAHAIEALTAYLTRCQAVLTRSELADLAPYYQSFIEEHGPPIAPSPEARAAIAKLQADTEARACMDRLAAYEPTRICRYWLEPDQPIAKEIPEP